MLLPMNRIHEFEDHFVTVKVNERYVEQGVLKIVEGGWEAEWYEVGNILLRSTEVATILTTDEGEIFVHMQVDKN